MNKQITVTLNEGQIEALQVIADKSFDGNVSMALRAVLRQVKIEEWGVDYTFGNTEES